MAASFLFVRSVSGPACLSLVDDSSGGTTSTGASTVRQGRLQRGSRWAPASYKYDLSIRLRLISLKILLISSLTLYV